MKKYLRPERLDCNPNSPSAPDEWRHRYRTIEKFFRALGVHEFNNLDAVVNFLSSAIYKYVADFTTYENAIRYLEGLYVKSRMRYSQHTCSPPGSNRPGSRLMNTSRNLDTSRKTAVSKRLQPNNTETNLHETHSSVDSLRPQSDTGYWRTRHYTLTRL